MKKILATVLCAGLLTTPCLACGRHDNYRTHHMPRKQPPRIERSYHGGNTFYHNRNHRHRTTAALATIAGVAGLAAIITAAY